MSLKRSGKYELTESVSDHFFVDIETHKSFAIVDGEGETNHLRHDLTCSIPYFDDFLVSAGVHLLHSLEQSRIDVKSFFE